jgi:predicted dehydrogenase
LFNVPNPHFPYNWFAQAGLGVSALRNLGSHALHLLTFLLGPIAELIADDGQLVSTWRFPDGAVIEPQTNDFACLLLRFVSGLRLQLQLCWSATLAAGWSVDVFGAQGRLLIEAPSFPTSRETALYVGTLRDGQLQRVEMPQRLLHAPGVAITAEVEPQPAYPMALSMQQLIQAVQQGGAVAPDFEQAWNVERTLEAARRSSLERRWISLEEVR